MRLKTLNFKKTFLACLLSGLFFISTAQVVSLYAGIPYIGRGQYYTVRTNPILNDYYSNPYGLAFDTSGRLYFTDEHNLMLIIGQTSYNRVGTPLDPTVNGGYADGTATAGLFNTPQGLAVHPISNDIYVCDHINHAIRKIEKFLNAPSSQTMTTHTGLGPGGQGHTDGTLAQAQFSTPTDIVIASNGDMYISDRGNHVIRKISGNTVSTIAGSPNTSGNQDGIGATARFYLPEGLFLQNDTTLWVADFGNLRIRKINLSTNQVTTVISTGLLGPRGISLVNENVLFISDRYNVKLFKNNTLSTYAGGETPDDVMGNGTEARFMDLMGIIFDPSDSTLIVADEGINTLKKITIDKNLFSSTTDTNTSVNSFLKTEIKLFPNPANSSLYLETPSPSEGVIEIQTILGQIIEMQTTSLSTLHSIDISMLSIGTYFLFYYPTNSQPIRLKFIVE